MELDDPIQSITTETSSGEFDEPNNPDYVGDYLLMSGGNNSNDADTESNDGYLQPIRPANFPRPEPKG